MAHISYNNIRFADYENKVIDDSAEYRSKLF